MLRSHFQLLVILNLNLSFIGEPNFLPSILIFADLLQIYLIFMMISVIYTNNLEYHDYTLYVWILLDTSLYSSHLL